MKLSIAYGVTEIESIQREISHHLTTSQSTE